MQVTRKSGFTGVVRTRDLPVTEEELKRWQDGAKAQVVWPHLSPGDREFIMTGVTEEEWADAVGDSDED